VNWLKKPSTTGGIIYLVVLAVLFVGLGIVTYGAWRTGTSVMGVAFGVAFVSRAVLPEERAGMLRVRRRYVDLTALGICCAGMIVLAAAIPSRPA